MLPAYWAIVTVFIIRSRKLLNTEIFSHENMEVKLEALTNTHIGLHATSREYNLRRTIEETIRWKKTVLFGDIGHEITFGNL
jgi:hypothetical protein